jgi:hypothetical protein
MINILNINLFKRNNNNDKMKNNKNIKIENITLSRLMYLN